MAIKCPKCNADNPDTKQFCGDCGTQLPSLEDVEVTETIEAPKEELTTGSTFAGRYQIIEELGKGGMGKVYRVLDKKLKEEIALKLIKPEIAKDKKTLERFHNELKLARKISQRNVGRMYELMEEDGTHFITMEYVPGEDLRSSIRRFGQLPIGKSISIAKQICEGLAEAHRLGVVHRDLKSNNIMIDKEGNVRIMDFGIARSLEAKGITGAGVMIGTPEYMSPEQVEGKEVDQRSDIYSLGIILYEMMTGRVPFEGDTPFTIGVKHKSEIPKNPKELNTQIPDDLSHLILRCLEKDKEKRYQSAGEVRSELNNIEKGIPTTEKVLPKRKPLTSREITVTFGLRKLLIPALALLALIIAGVIIWKVLPRKEVVPIPSDKPSLAIMYFKNNTGDDALDHWRSMLSNLLIADLTQSKHIRVLGEDRLFQILSQLDQLEGETYSSDVLKQVAAQGQVSHILQGAYAKAGDEFRINVTLQEAESGELIGSELVAGKGEENIFTMVDELTKRIKTNFQLSEEKIANDIDREVGNITTSSPEALKYYIEGVKYHRKGEYHKSITLMEEAVEIDPEFAMAYRSLALSYNNIGFFSERRKYIQKALEFSNRLSDRERLKIIGDYYWESQKTYGKAIEAYEKLVEFYPEDASGNHNLGILYSNLGEVDKAIERFKVAINNNTEFFLTYAALADRYKGKGMYRKAEEILEYYLENFSDNARIHQELALSYIHQGKLDPAVAEIDKAFILKPDDYMNIMLKGDIYFFRDDLVGAEEEFQKMLTSKDPAGQGMGMWRLARVYQLQGKFEKAKELFQQGVEHSKKLDQKLWEAWSRERIVAIYMAAGNPREALEECQKAWKIYKEREDLAGLKNILHLRGLAFLEMNSVDQARRVANELKKMIEEGIIKKDIRHYYHLTGKLELEKENFSEAIVNFEKALSFLSFQHSTWSEFVTDRQALYIEGLALAYYKTGNIEKALKEYEKITELTTGRLCFGDIYAKSFYMLGKIHEEQGNTAKATEHFEKFLDLWKDADPGIAEVEDARKRLAVLK